MSYDRMQKISKIIPEFSRVAEVGDEVMMGLEGDPKFPYTGRDRPMATITDIRRGDDGISLQLRRDDGQLLDVDEYTMSPSLVWEFSDTSFKNVLEREKEKSARAEQSMYRGSTSYDGELDMLRKEVQELRSDVEKERRTMQDFHNTYIASLYEISGDVCSMDTTGSGAKFCRTFSSEYNKMKARAEDALYRGTADANYRGTDELDEDEDDESEEEEDSLSDVEFAAKDDMGQSDYF